MSQVDIPIVDIEFAHIDLEPVDLAVEQQEIRDSAVVAGMLIEGLNRSGFHWKTSVLVDDKRIQSGSADRVNIESALERVSRFIGPVPIHRALLESSLSTLMSPFIELFDRRKGASVARDFHRYQTTREGTLGCSQDISVWYAVRLGLIPPETVVRSISPDAWFGFDNDEQRLALISILSERHRPYERRADEKILSLLDHGSLLHRVFRIYTAEDPTSESINTRIAAVIDSIRSLHETVE